MKTKDSGTPDVDTVRDRRVEPVPESYDPDAGEDRGGRPALAVWLTAGPILALFGLLGWLRMLSGVPKSTTIGFDGWALTQDIFLLFLFIASHSLLARGFGRRLLNRPFGPAAERPLYVLVTGITLSLMTWAWVDTGPLMWRWSGFFSVVPRLFQIFGLLLAGWAVTVIGLGRMSGLSHLKALESNRSTPGQEFVGLPPYAWIRQPLNAGFLLLMVGMPEVTLDRLVMLLVMGAWILLVAPFEERDAELEFGRGYEMYRARTPRWFPSLRRKDS